MYNACAHLLLTAPTEPCSRSLLDAGGGGVSVFRGIFCDVDLSGIVRISWRRNAPSEASYTVYQLRAQASGAANGEPDIEISRTWDTTARALVIEDGAAGDIYVIEVLPMPASAWSGCCPYPRVRGAVHARLVEVLYMSARKLRMQLQPGSPASMPHSTSCFDAFQTN